MSDQLGSRETQTKKDGDDSKHLLEKWVNITSSNFKTTTSATKDVPAQTT